SPVKPFGNPVEPEVIKTLTWPGAILIMTYQVVSEQLHGQVVVGDDRDTDGLELVVHRLEGGGAAGREVVEDVQDRAGDRVVDSGGVGRRRVRTARPAAPRVSPQLAGASPTYQARHAARDHIAAQTHPYDLERAEASRQRPNKPGGNPRRRQVRTDIH